MIFFYNLSFQQYAAKSFKYIFTIAEANVSQVKEYGADRVVVVKHGIEISEKSVNKKSNQVMTAARLIKDKGVHNVIQLFKEIVKINPGSKLLILGDGPELNSLVNLSRELGIEENVDFLGHRSEQFVNECMSESLIFLLLSNHAPERLPNVIKEGMNNKCIVITTMTPGIHELVVNEKTGFVVDGDDYLKTCEIMESIMMNPDQYCQIAENARDMIRENYDLDKEVDKYLNCWSSHQK